jgi:translation elongation factor EF-Tu-like GTPase
MSLTSVITSVSYGDRERVLIHWDWWSYTSEVPLGDLAQYVTQEGNPGNQRRVVRAEVQLPVEILRLGFCFIDTPGVGSAIAANTATTTAFLPEADAVVFLTSFESPLAEAELQFLDRVRRHVRKIFVVVNKRDLVSPEQQEAVVAFVQERLREVFGEICPPVYSVSARDALNAKQSGDAGKLSRSGLPQLEADLIDFLQTDKTREFLARVAHRTGNILCQQAVEFEVSRTLGADVEKIDSSEKSVGEFRFGQLAK